MRFLGYRGDWGEAADQGHFDFSGLNGEIHAPGNFVNLYSLLCTLSEQFLGSLLEVATLHRTS